MTEAHEPEEPAAVKTARFKALAEKWLSTPEGRREMLEDIKRTLIVHMLWEREEGQNPRETRSGPNVARQSRKQYKEIAELVMAVEDKLKAP